MVVSVVGLGDGGSDWFEGEQDSVGFDDSFDESDGELDVDVAGWGCVAFGFVLEFDDALEVPFGAGFVAVDHVGGLASDAAFGVAPVDAVSAAVSECGLE